MPLSQELENVHKIIIQVHRELFGESPSPMKLQKLCYYAQGYALAQGIQLFDDDFQAWQHGPVIYELYNRYREYQWRPINEEMELQDNEHSDFIRDVVTAYGRFDGAALSTMTHREQPWLSSRGDLDESEGCCETIDKDSLRNYFSRKLRVNGEE